MAARSEWLTANAARSGRRKAPFKRQRIALAPSLKAGDTSAEVEDIEFGAEAQAAAKGLQNYSEKLSRPAFYPSVLVTRVRIAALAQLSGADKSNLLSWNLHYLKNGFDAANKGQVFATVEAEPDMAKLDFSTQGDRSGGFVQPNLKPSALSRLTGPVSGDPTKFLQGKLEPAGVFPTSLSDLPLPLLFGCIPLGEVIEAVAEPGRQPAEGAEVRVRSRDAGGEFRQRPGARVRVRARRRRPRRHAGPGGHRRAAGHRAGPARPDACAAGRAGRAGGGRAEPAEGRAHRAAQPVQRTRAGVTGRRSCRRSTTAPNLATWPALVNAVLPHLTTLGSAVNAATLPSGFKQGALGLVDKAQQILNDIKALSALIPQGKTLYGALDAIVGHPESLGDLFSHPDQLAAKLTDVSNAIGPIRTTLAGFQAARRRAEADAARRARRRDGPCSTAPRNCSNCSRC